MAQLVVRNLGDEVKKGLQLRAILHGHSMEEEARNILSAAASQNPGSPRKLGSWVAGLFKNKGLSKPIKEHRGQSADPVTFV